MLLRSNHLTEIFGVSAGTLRARVRAGNAPPPKKNEYGVLVWGSDDVAAWIRDRAALLAATAKSELATLRTIVAEGGRR